VDARWVIWWWWSERDVDAKRCLVHLGRQEGHHLHEYECSYFFIRSHISIARVSPYRIKEMLMLNRRMQMMMRGFRTSSIHIGENQESKQEEGRAGSRRVVYVGNWASP
jgi:hypothetical protein